MSGAEDHPNIVKFHGVYYERHGMGDETWETWETWETLETRGQPGWHGGIRRKQQVAGPQTHELMHSPLAKVGEGGLSLSETDTTDV